MNTSKNEKNIIKTDIVVLTNNNNDLITYKKDSEKVLNTNVESESIAISLFLNKIHEDIGYCKFNPYLIRKRITSTRRTDLSNMKRQLRILEKKKVLTRISNNEYKFNLKNERECYITNKRLELTLTDIFRNELIDEDYLVAELRRKLNSKNVKILSLINSLINDGILLLYDKQASFKKHYSLNL